MLGNFSEGEGETPISPDELGNFGLMEIKWGTWDWPLIFSSEERAIIEMLQDVPERASIYEAYVLLQGRVNLRPERVSALLRACTSIKAKRLFLALAARQRHAWFKHLDLAGVDCGKGKRRDRRRGKGLTHRIALAAAVEGLIALFVGQARGALRALRCNPCQAYRGSRGPPSYPMVER